MLTTRLQWAATMAAGWVLIVANGAFAQLDYGSVDRPADAKDEVAVQDGVAIRWLTAFEGVPIYKEKECTTEIGKLGFRDEYFELWRDETAVLLASGTSTATSSTAEKVVGFAKQTDAISSTKHNTYRAARAASGVFRKAIVVHRWDEKGQAVVKEAALLDRPAADGQQLGSVMLFEFLYIYALAGNSEDGYCLVGTTPYLEVASKDLAEERLLGWLANRRVFFWDHREGVEFNKEREAFRGRSTKKSPITCYIAPNLDADKEPTTMSDLVSAYAEDLSKSAPWPYYVQRYPIIARNIEVDGREFFKLGVIGDTYDAGTGKIVAKVDLEARLRQELAKMEEQARNIDVMFVIDASGSMDKYWASIKTSVEKIRDDFRASRLKSDATSQLPEGDDGQIHRDETPVRYGVFYYRDYTEESVQGSWSKYFVDLATESTFAESFPHVDSDGGEDNPPPLFGIHSAATEASWGDGSERVVILIGDMGNEVPDKRGFDTTKVVDILKRNRCQFFAIQAQPKSVVRDERLQRFNSQAKEVATALEMPEELRETLAADGTNVGEAVRTALLASNKRATVIHEVLKMLQEGQPMTDAISKMLKEVGIDPGTPGSSPAEAGQPNAEFEEGSWGLSIQKALLDKFKDNGIDPSVFKLARIQHFGIAYSPVRIEGADDDSFETRILMTRAEFQQFTGIVMEVVRKGVTIQNVTELWRTVATNVSGDLDDPVQFNEKTPLSEYMTKVLGIPIRSGLLTKSVEEIKGMEPDELSALRAELEKTQNVLNNIDNEMNAFGTMSEKRWFKIHGVEYGWIPDNILP